MGDTPKIAMARARLAVLQEDFDTAVAASNTVLKTDPADLRALRMVGDAYMGRSQAAAHKDLRDTHLHRYTDNADLQTALGHFRTVLADRPKDRHAIYALLTAYGRSSLPTTPQLIAATRIYEDEYFEGRSPSTMVHFANIYARNGDEARACSYYGAARSIVDSVKTRYETDIKARLAQFEATHGSLCQS